MSRRDYEFREAEPTVRSEEFSRELHDEPGESQPTGTADDAEARADFWSIQGDFILRHHNEPRVQLCVPKEETFPFPLKYIDVTGSNHTDLDVVPQKRIDHCWNVESTKFTLLKEKTPKRFFVVPVETDKDSNNCRAKDNRASRRWLRSRRKGSEKNSKNSAQLKSGI